MTPCRDLGQADWTVSVVVPVRNDPKNLELCLEALQASEARPLEVIVVDDASDQDVTVLAQRFGARTVRLERQSGPGVARNTGARLAKGRVLVFVDADVVFRPDTIALFLESFQADARVDAVFGSYDKEPGAGNILSQYRNLLHHFVHQSGNEEAFSFWSGCGAIKSEVFASVGCFDPSFDRPSIEDIELGARLHRKGHRVVLNKRIQVRHMKNWSLWGMVKCDIFHRGVPWTLLLLRERNWPNDLNLKHSQKLAMVLSLGFLLSMLFAVASHLPLIVLPFLALVSILALDAWTAKRRVPLFWRFSAAAGGVGIVAFVLESTFHDRSVMLWILVALGFLLGVVLVNFRLYLFYSRLRTPFFAPLAVGLHILYYSYCMLALGLGCVQHVVSHGFGRPRERGSFP